MTWHVPSLVQNECVGPYIVSVLSDWHVRCSRMGFSVVECARHNWYTKSILRMDIDKLTSQPGIISSSWSLLRLPLSVNPSRFPPLIARFDMSPAFSE